MGSSNDRRGASSWCSDLTARGVMRMSTIEPSGAAGASAAPEAVAVGQMGVEPREPGTAGALNNVSQQLGSAMGVALISTFVATATSHYLTRHGSTAVA